MTCFFFKRDNIVTIARGTRARQFVTQCRIFTYIFENYKAQTRVIFVLSSLKNLTYSLYVREFMCMYVFANFNIDYLRHNLSHEGDGFFWILTWNRNKCKLNWRWLSRVNIFGKFKESGTPEVNFQTKIPVQFPGNFSQLY